MRVLLSSSSGSAVITTLGFSRWLLPCGAETTAAHNASSATPTIRPRAMLGRLFVVKSLLRALIEPSIRVFSLGDSNYLRPSAAQLQVTDADFGLQLDYDTTLPRPSVIIPLAK